jgi:hypothetical protein
MTPEGPKAERRGSPSGIPRVVYQVRCPACGGLRRPSEFAREIEPVTDCDLVGQRFLGRSKIETFDVLSYRVADLHVAAIRRRWLARLRRAVHALEGLTYGIARRFPGIGTHTTVTKSFAVASVAAPVTVQIGGIHGYRVA